MLLPDPFISRFRFPSAVWWDKGPLGRAGPHGGGVASNVPKAQEQRVPVAQAGMSSLT